MQDHLYYYADYLWLALGLVWLIGALAVKRTERTQTSSSRMRHLALEVAAFFLVFGRIQWPAWLAWRFVPQQSMPTRWMGLALTAAGIGFAIAARLWIGSNWSGRVTIKEQHQLIQNGPMLWCATQSTPASCWLCWGRPSFTASCVDLSASRWPLWAGS